MSLFGDGIELLKTVNMGANAPLYTSLGKFVGEVQELQQQREKLEQEVRELREQLRFKGMFSRLLSCTYVDGDDEPVCSRCAEVDHRPVHFVVQRHPNMG